jgi:hypothetical protein
MAEISHLSDIERREYLVENFHVTFESGTAWHCACVEFMRSRVCRHTREAAGMRAAQAKIFRHLERGGLPRPTGHDDADISSVAPDPGRRSDWASTTR